MDWMTERLTEPGTGLAASRWERGRERERVKGGGGDREKRWPTGEEVWTGAGPLKEEPADGERHSQFSYRKEGGRENRREEWRIETAEKRIGAEIRTLLMVRWTDRKMGWAWSERVVRLHHAASVFDASVSLSRAARWREGSRTEKMREQSDWLEV